MSRVYLTAVAGLALVVSACAHTRTATTSHHESYLGGRAGQPAGWPDQLAADSTPSPNQWRAATPAGQQSYLGGRAAQPAGGSESSRAEQQPPQAATPYSCGASRAGEPFPGPGRC